jgi:hypothetical protein
VSRIEAASPAIAAKQGWTAEVQKFLPQGTGGGEEAPLRQRIAFSVGRKRVRTANNLYDLSTFDRHSVITLLLFFANR